MKIFNFELKQIEVQVWDTIYKTTSSQVIAKIRSEVSHKIWDRVVGSVRNEVRDHVENQMMVHNEFIV